MDDQNIQYELMDDDIVQTHIRSRQVKEWWRRAIRKQIKINQDSRMAHAHNEVLRRERGSITNNNGSDDISSIYGTVAVNASHRTRSGLDDVQHAGLSTTRVVETSSQLFLNSLKSMH